MSSMRFSRREFARLSAAAGAVVAGYPPLLGAAVPALTEFGYGDVTVDSAVHQAQLQNTHDVLMNLSEDSLLKPFRQMVGQPAPGDDLGGWYNYDPNFNWHTDDAGFAPRSEEHTSELQSQFHLVCRLLLEKKKKKKK